MEYQPIRWLPAAVEIIDEQLVLFIESQPPYPVLGGWCLRRGVDVREALEASGPVVRCMAAEPGRLVFGAVGLEMPVEERRPIANDPPEMCKPARAGVDWGHEFTSP